MHTLLINRAMVLVFAFFLVVPMSAFTLRGGEGFEIYLGKTLMIRQFLNIDKVVKTIDLAAASVTDELTVSFNHCGQTGTNRVVSVRDKSVVLKVWRFPDMKQGGTVNMNIPVKDIAEIQKNVKGKQLSLFYSSDLMKEGRVLAVLTSGSARTRLR